MEFEKIVTEHRGRYPCMEPQDYGKLAYQSEYGAEHLVTDGSAVDGLLREEWSAVPLGTSAREPEKIGHGLCRFYLYDLQEKELAVQIIVKLFCLTAKEHIGSRDGLEEKLKILEKLPVPGMEKWMAVYRAQGCPPVRHSEAFRNAYHPHYRLLKLEYARFFPALLEVAKLLEQDKPVVVAIDGRCGSGKTTLSALMARVFDCNVFHMDDFYLPKSQRQGNWLSVPGGNMDLKRFQQEVLEPVLSGREVLYRPFDCASGTLGTGIQLEPKKLTIIEGSYSHHSNLNAKYDLKIFLTCDKEEQRRRLMRREGEHFSAFERIWMPLEEQYIRLCRIEDSGAVIYDTTSS